MTAKGWMLEKSWKKLVVLDNCHILLLECSLPGPEHGGVHHPLLLVRLLTVEGHDQLFHCISVCSGIHSVQSELYHPVTAYL